MAEQNTVQARKLETVRVLKTDKPDIMILQFETAGGLENFAVTRSSLSAISAHIGKAALALATGD